MRMKNIFRGIAQIHVNPCRIIRRLRNCATQSRKTHHHQNQRDPRI
jgi:hypothetical protein